MHPNVHCSTVYNSQEMSINRRMDKDVVQVYNGILLSYKKGGMLFATTQIDLEIIILSEVNQTEKKYCMTSLTRGIKKETIQMNLQNRKRLTDLGNKLLVAKEEG